jgi:hypothetical protein
MANVALPFHDDFDMGEEQVGRPFLPDWPANFQPCGIIPVFIGISLMRVSRLEWKLTSWAFYGKCRCRLEGRPYH